MFEPTDDTSTVDVDTDDLDAFSDLFHGKAAEAPSVDDNKEDKSDHSDDNDDNQDDNSDDNSDDLDEDKEDKSEDDDKPEQKPKKVNRYQERINELTAKAREAERALEALKAEQQKQKEPDRPTPSVELKDNGPTPNDKNDDGSDKYPLGEFDPEFIRDMARHTIEKEWAAKEAQRAQQEAQRQEQEVREQLQAQWVEKLTPVTEQYEDFLDKTMELESAFDGLDPQYSDYLVQTIKSLDHGPEVLYYFANNLDEAQKFVRMGPLAATLALGEYNAMFKGQTRKEAKVTNAPIPPQVNKGSKTRTTVAPDTDDLDAFEKMFFSKKR